MSARYLGSVTIGAALPGASVLASAGVSGIKMALPDLQSRLAALLGWSPQPITFAAQIEQLNLMLGALQQSITLGVQPPSLAVQLANIASLVAGLQASIASLNTQLQLIQQVQSVLAMAGLHLVAFDGRADALGSEVGGVLGGVSGVAPGDIMHAVLMATTSPAVFQALSQLVKVNT